MPDDLRSRGFAAADFEHILITFNILGPQKLERLSALNENIAELKVVADSAVTVDGLSTHFAGRTLATCSNVWSVIEAVVPFARRNENFRSAMIDHPAVEAAVCAPERFAGYNRVFVAAG